MVALQVRSTGAGAEPRKARPSERGARLEHLLAPPQKKICTASLRLSTTFPLLLHLPHRADVFPEAPGVVVKVENPSRSGVEFAAGF